MNASNASASAEIWDWKAAPVPDAKGSGRSVRLKGVIQGLITAGVAALMWRFGYRHMAMVVGSVSGLVIFLALVSPNFGFAALERLVQGIGTLIGKTLGWIVLFSLFYFFIVPFGKIFRRAKRDTLKRRFEPEAPTYWSERPSAKATGGRRKQF